MVFRRTIKSLRANNGVILFDASAGRQDHLANPAELLLTSFDEKMDNQLAILNEHFQSWKGDFEQIDDVTIMGIRV